jgi:predicted DNA-binding protein YlxM (UPF0122 family)
MERTNQINLLYDYYGQLLTERQGRIIELYYWNNLSLQEIQYKVSRQSVHDILKRSEQSLRYFEEKLGLVGNSSVQREKLSKVMDHLNSCSNSDIENAKQILSQIIQEE